MTLHRHALSALALFVGGALLAPAPAEAMNIFVAKLDFQTTSEDIPSLRVTVVDPDAEAAAVDLRVSSDAGDEDVTLVESDAWLHGGASIAALPKTDATLTLTLYDNASASLMSFSGTLGTDGSVTLVADATKDTGGGGACDVSSKTGCASDTSDTSDTSTTTPDIEVLAGEVFAASSGYELGLDLAGADTYAVAYAEITVTESDEVTTCSKETEECTTTGSTTTATAEVGWDDIGAIWEGELATEPEGLIEVKVKAYDATGKKLESAKVKLGVPWLDGGEGVNVLATDEDPLTTVGLLPGFDRNNDGTIRANDSVWRLAVTSSGWTLGDSLPVDAEVELTNGDTITIPVNSYQRKKKEEDRITEESDRQKGAESVDIEEEDRPFADHDGPFSLDDLASPLCSEGTCVVFVPDGDGAYDVSVSAYGTDAARLPDDMTLGVTWYDEFGEKLSSETILVEFDDEITAVFANEVSFSEDPIGLDLSGKVSLLGDANSKGKQKTLAKGKFYGSFSRDGDGDLELAGADKDEVVSSGDIVVDGEAIGLDDGQGGLDTPPVILYNNGNVTVTSCIMDKVELALDVDVK